MMYCLFLDDESEKCKTKEREFGAVPDHSIPITSRGSKRMGVAFFFLPWRGG
jgi:hypothetical protein